MPLRRESVRRRVDRVLVSLTPEQTRFALAMLMLIPWALMLSCVGTVHALAAR